jgi:phage gp29-like protein
MRRRELAQLDEDNEGEEGHCLGRLITIHQSIGSNKGYRKKRGMLRILVWDDSAYTTIKL